MSSVLERNNLAKFYVNSRLEVAKTKSQSDFSDYQESSEIYELMSDLIEVKAKGFRGIVVTAITGLHLDKSYDPINNFYSTNPRSIFEGGIWYALQENQIPCGKSDPLNVAKNANLIDNEWAKGKRPQSAAMAAVRFLKILMEATVTTRANLIDYFFFRLWQYAKSINDFNVIEVEPSKTKQETGNQIVDFSLAYPESGNIPQTLLSQLLTKFLNSSDKNIQGGSDSVFSTNTTSKKPADIWIEENGVPTNLYEITVKPISKKRLDDSIQALQASGYLNHSITFICRFPQDVKDLQIENGVYTYRGKTFEFIDYKYFCMSVITLLSKQEFQEVMEFMSSYIGSINISMKTKQGWNAFFN